MPLPGEKKHIKENPDMMATIRIYIFVMLDTSFYFIFPQTIQYTLTPFFFF